MGLQIFLVIVFIPEPSSLDCSRPGLPAKLKPDMGREIFLTPVWPVGSLAVEEDEEGVPGTCFLFEEPGVWGDFLNFFFSLALTRTRTCAHTRMHTNRVLTS